jgi:SAM-dependent methyltransferase
MTNLDELEVGEHASQRRFPTHQFQFNARQLCFLCKCLEDTRMVEGSIAEIGCEHGHTTVFLNNYLDDISGSERRYFAIDTFAGFPEADISFEVENRLKDRRMYGAFADNRKEWFQKTMTMNKISRVEAIEADVNDFDLRSLGPLSFVLLDVDLYRSTKNALPQIYEMLSPGGILVVDDCDSTQFFWDGAAQAFREFAESIKITPRVMHKKLGVIRKI